MSQTSAMKQTDEVTRKPRTLAEAQGMTAEIGRGIAAIANEELQAGRLATARDILHGLAVSNPYDAATWAMLAVLERRRGKLIAARICAEAGYRLAPRDEQIRLVRAEVLLCTPPERPRAIAELRELASLPGPVGDRATALLTAAGDSTAPRSCSGS
jgi:predicted Zn-dependent protease